MKYVTTTAIRHKGRLLPAGSPVDMSEKAAAALRPGTVVPPKEEKSPPPADAADKTGEKSVKKGAKVAKGA